MTQSDFDKLKALGIYDQTLIVFLADHGESLGERGYVGHNQLYHVQLHIPLIMHIPGVGAQRHRTGEHHRQLGLPRRRRRVTATSAAAPDR